MKLRIVLMVMALYSVSLLMAMEKSRYGQELGAWNRASMVKVMQEARDVSWQESMERLYQEAVSLNEAFENLRANIAMNDENVSRYQCEYCQIFYDPVFGLVGLNQRFQLLNALHEMTPEVIAGNNANRLLYNKVLMEMEKANGNH